MLTFGERFKKKQKYFLNLCPDIPLGEQTELRDIGMGQLQIMTSTIVAAGSMSESTPYLNFFTAAISEILNAVSTRKEIIVEIILISLLLMRKEQIWMQFISKI